MIENGGQYSLSTILLFSDVYAGGLDVVATVQIGYGIDFSPGRANAHRR